MTDTLSISYGDTIERLQREFTLLPNRMDRARARAYKKLGVVVQRQILRAASAAAKIPQKQFKAMMRLYAKPLGNNGADGISFWIGTNDLKVHRLGEVQWTPYRGLNSRPRNRPKAPSRASGAKVGGKLYANAWSWGGDSKTGPAVMFRRGDTRLPIEVLKLPIHDLVKEALTASLPDLATRFETLLRQELNYAVNVERNRA